MTLPSCPAHHPEARRCTSATWRRIFPGSISRARHMATGISMFQGASRLESFHHKDVVIENTHGTNRVYLVQLLELIPKKNAWILLLICWCFIFGCQSCFLSQVCEDAVYTPKMLLEREDSCVKGFCSHPKKTIKMCLIYKCVCVYIYIYV